MGGSFGPLVAGIFVALRRGGSGRQRGRQVAKLPRRVRGTPAQVPADASASVKAGYLTEDCREEEERLLEVSYLLAYSSCHV